MDEDDDFGDLYSDLGGGESVAAGAAAEGGRAAGLKPGLALGDDDDDDDGDGLYSNVVKVGFSRQDDEPEEQAEVSRLAPQDVAGDEGSGRLQSTAADGSDSESDDDIQIVLAPPGPGFGHSAPAAASAAVVESEAATAEVHEEAEETGPTWAEEQQPAPASEAPQQPPMGPPGGFPPGLMPVEQPPSRPSMPPNAGLGRPPGRPFMAQNYPPYKYLRGPMPGGPMMPGPPNGPGLRFPGWRPGQPRAFGMPGYNSEFHLPPTKSVFDMDLDAMEDKPWRHPGADVTDYFNFGFNEMSWKAYCQHLSQLRLEATMQSKISVYESNRSEQPIGRAIQVEWGLGERRASTDVPKRNRNRDPDAVIEIVLQDAVEDNPTPVSDVSAAPEEDQESMGSRAAPRNGQVMEDGAPFFPMGPRGRNPYRLPPPPFSGRGMRPAFYESGIPPMPVQMRPEFSDYDPSRRGTPASGPSKSRGMDDEQSTGSVPEREDRKHGDSREDRRSKTSRRISSDHRDQNEDDKSEELKRSLSEEEKYEQARRRRHESSRSQREGGKHANEADYSSGTDDEGRKRRRSRKDDYPEDDRVWQKKASTSDEKDRRPDKEPRRDDSAKRSRDDSAKTSKDDRWKEEDLRKHREREDDTSRRREDGRKREAADEHWQRKDREGSYRREREREEPRRRSAYEESYDRRDRDRDKDRDREKDRERERASRDRDRERERERERDRDRERERDEEYLRRKSSNSSKHESSQRREYRDPKYEEELYDRKLPVLADKSSSRRDDYAADRPKEKEDERILHKDKYSSSSRDGKRNGSTSEYLDERLERKKRKATDEYHKEVHAEKVAAREQEDKTSAGYKTASKLEPLLRHGGRADEPVYSSDEDDEGRRRKGRSKMERWNRERPPLTKEESWVHEQVEQKAAASSKQVANGQSYESVAARRRERFQTDEKKASDHKVQAQAQLLQAQEDASEFKHERPARKRRWGS